jgi:hypothetical protein
MTKWITAIKIGYEVYKAFRAHKDKLNEGVAVEQSELCDLANYTLKNYIAKNDVKIIKGEE